MKDCRRDKSKAKAFIPTFTQDFELFDKVRKDKKKKQHKAKRDFTNPAIGINKVKIGNYKKRKKNINEIIYYNCNKKGHYLDKCPEPWKSKN